jgi:ketosteroid isomerase-like protein
MSMALSADDRIDLHELVARYGAVVDDCDLDALGTVYADDAVMVLLLANGREVRKQGLGEIGEFLAASNSTNAHILTNITTAVEDDGPDEQVVLRYRMGAPEGADLFSIDYRDVVVRTDAGWRIAHHTITMRGLPSRG